MGTPLLGQLIPQGGEIFGLQVRDPAQLAELTDQQVRGGSICVPGERRQLAGIQQGVLVIQEGVRQVLDVLAKTGSLILDYAWEYLQCGVRNWNPSSERAYQPNDDSWYVLATSKRSSVHECSH